MWLPKQVSQQTVAHGAAGRAGSEINVVRRGPVNGGVRRDGIAYDEAEGQPTHGQGTRRVASQVEGACKVIDAFSPTDAEQPLTLAALDRAFAAWLATETTDNQLVNGAINCVGVAFGQFLVDGVGFAWVIASDKIGSDLAVYGLPGNGDVLMYPANFVAKRWERPETDFLETSYKQIADQVQAIGQTNAAKPAGKPWWKFW